ncbi:MAG: hypothetical protein HY046_05135 [Acidobacteria bacterium]|nr:hypothetical protein [Acidobacteriota bacterium]
MRIRLLIVATFSVVAALFLALNSHAQTGNTQDRDAEFKRLAAQIVAQRQAGKEEKPELQVQAMAILDLIVKAGMGNPSRDSALQGADLLKLNTRLEALASQPAPVGESYRALAIREASPPLLALVANFGLSGPSAVRIYTPMFLTDSSTSATRTEFGVIGRIDRFVFPDYFDEYLEVVPVTPSAGVFVTVTGRTDDRKTGSFAAWRFDGNALQSVWSSDLLERSSYETKDGEFRVTYCSETDEDKPSVCKKMVRDHYTWSSGWQRVAQEDVTPKTPPR